MVHSTRRSMHRIHSCQFLCLDIILKCLKPITFPMSLDNSSSLEQSLSIKVFKWYNLQRELGGFLTLLCMSRLKYLRCFRLPMELGNASNLDSINPNTCSHLNLKMHPQTNDLLLGAFFFWKLSCEHCSDPPK